ncbi:formate dehydrogenase subunit gamma [Litorisediminicola beolgyonensis]|uniref:Formate dehydrogenase subunit gamma n=1 Tax=Litorisediminicola beolgyonensis TaxID=1173614 RepID=A0ABW3ZJH8_9RHOB
MRVAPYLVMLFALLATALPVSAQQDAVEPPASDVSGEAAPASPGSTLEDILRRQQGLEANNDERRQFVGSDAEIGEGVDALSTLGGSSDSDLWRAFRFDERDISTQVRAPAASTIMQDNGMWWLELREGPVLHWGGYLLLGTIALLAIFYLIKGRIRIDGERTGRTIERFTGIERFGHWLIAGSFVILGLTGLITLMGRKFLIPAFGHEVFSDLAIASKWLHNNVAWAFMLGLVMVFMMWVWHNIPTWQDVKWLARGGGFIGKGHVPAPKFNAGQKIIFWSVVILGASVSASGLSLLFPFDLQMFAPTFATLNELGVPGLLGVDPFTSDLSPQGEMQYAQLWHAIVAFVFMAIILAHIYIGTIGMEGAFEAMGSGEVDTQWAKEHHSIWYEKKMAEERAAPKGATPAE